MDATSLTVALLKIRLSPWGIGGVGWGNKTSTRFLLFFTIVVTDFRINTHVQVLNKH